MTEQPTRPTSKPVRPMTDDERARRALQFYGRMESKRLALIYGYDTVAQMLEAMARVRGEVKK